MPEKYTIPAPAADTPQDKGYMDYTRHLHQFLEWKEGAEMEELDPAEHPELISELAHKHRGRPIIARNMPIDGGVYLTVTGGVNTTPHGEAIVVDSEKQPELKAAYAQLQRILKRQKLFSRFTGKGGSTIQTVYDYVRKRLPYDLPLVKKVEAAVGRSDKVALAAYLNYGGGVCRHQALFAGFLLERLIKEDQFRGSISVDRSFVPRKGGHAWTRYTSPSGQVIIIDPAQNFVGTLKEAMEQKKRWPYARPGEGELTAGK